MLKVVSNTTPFISLLKISKIELLRDIYGRIIIPKGVFEEIERGNNKTFYADLSKMGWIDIRKIKDKSPLKYLHDLDNGEAEVLVLANEIKADIVIIDEKLGREYAAHFNLNITGTIGILLKAKKLKLIKEIKPVLSEMTEKGIWLNNSLIEKILILAKEI